MTFELVISLLGGLALFLFGMRVMGDGLERAAGPKLKHFLTLMTKNRFVAMITGLCVTAIIQSSGATTVMVVGFVNAQLLSLAQAVGVIMGANIGTTVTSLLLSIEFDPAAIFAFISTGRGKDAAHHFKRTFQEMTGGVTGKRNKQDSK